MAKKTITIRIDENTFNGLNNAYIAYNDIIFACLMGCEVPEKFKKLKNLSDEELCERRTALLEMYREIERQFFN